MRGVSDQGRDRPPVTFGLISHIRTGRFTEQTRVFDADRVVDQAKGERAAWLSDTKTYRSIKANHFGVEQSGATLYLIRFVDAGTTIYAAHELERQWIGCDIAILAVKLN